jgi:hypothetical protein
MIEISQSRMAAVEYLLTQSEQGNHILFDISLIREALETADVSAEEAYSVEPLLERLFELPTLGHKQHFIASLPKETRSKLVRVYFNVVENALVEGEKIRQ